MKRRRSWTVYRLLPPRMGRRRYWVVQLRLPDGRRIQRSTRSPHREAARQYAALWVTQDYPLLAQLLNLRPQQRHKLPAEQAEQPHLV